MYTFTFTPFGQRFNSVLLSIETEHYSIAQQISQQIAITQNINKQLFKEQSAFLCDDNYKITLLFYWQQMKKMLISDDLRKNCK